MHRELRLKFLLRGSALALALTWGCGLSRKADQVGTVPVPSQTGAEQGRAGQPAPAPSPATGAISPSAAAAQVAPERRVLVFEPGGQDRTLDRQVAEAAGYTVVDLSDNWTPFLFQTLKDDTQTDRPNRYRRLFVGLANDELDSDGQKLDPGEKNYLELFGIPPALSVLRARFMDDQGRTCEAEVDFAWLQQAKPVRYFERERYKKVEAAARSQRARLEARRRALGLETLAELADKEPRLAKETAEAERWEAEQHTLREVEKRLSCEGLLSKKARHQPGLYDDGLQEAVRRFQQKHMIYEAPYLRPRTLAAMGRRLIENNHEALRRVLTERLVAATGIVEDGSVEGKDGAYRGAAGDPQRVRNLVEEYSGLFLSQLGLSDPAAALAFMTRFSPADLRWLAVGAKLPPRPEYQGPQMDLQLVIDRGDVWYDVPFDEQGKSRSQPRERYPTITLWARYREQRFALSRWRTTVGGWRSEQAGDGYEYYRYKGSDVGPRVIRHIASGPVWIAPETTPIRTLVKGRKVNRAWESVVNYDEIGPGYRSAYGLVAGYFVVPGDNGKPDWDNGIRAHGSVDYLSIASSEGFSHGCHRMQNHLAVRLYSFILQHRSMHVLGDQPLGYSRQFLYKDQAYELRLPSRGFAFQLDPPLPVNVLEGRVKGERKQPYTDYVPKPGVVYPGPPPKPGKGGDDRAGGDE